MKSVYKIGRLYIVSFRLFECMDPFLLENLQCDENAEEFFDENGVSVTRPASFNIDKNVLFIDFKIGIPDLDNSVKISEETEMTVLRIGSDWVYSYRYGNGWLQIDRDYIHATYFSGERDESGVVTTIPHPILMSIQCRLLQMGYLIIHSACIEVEGKAVLFSAPSGVGKSTRAERWIEAYGASFISGDRPIIDPARGTALGAPLDGKEQIHRNVEVPIAAFNCIKRSEKTKFTRLSSDDKKRFLATQAFIPMWDPMLVAKVFTGIKQMINGVRIWELACDYTIEAARECHDIIFPKEPKNVVELLSQLKALDTPKEQIAVLVNRFMDFKARKLGIPYSGGFELTPLCNLDCKMCYVHLNKEQLAGASLLSLERWKNIIKEAQAAGMRTAKFTGGECLTYPHFEELYLYTQSLGIQTNVYTNGILLDDKRIDFFKKHPAVAIQVTLYGSNDDVYEKVTGVRCFDLVYRNILKAREAGLPVRVAITPNIYSYDDMPALLDLVEKSGFVYAINAKLFNPRENTKRELNDLTDEQYIEIYRIQAEVKSDSLQVVDPEELPEVSDSGEKEVGIKCGAGRSSFTVSWDGKIMPCVNLSFINKEYSEGNFLESWKSINDWACNLELPCECGSCAYREGCIQCIAQHYDSKNIGHCNKYICERSKKMAAAGVIGY